MMRVVQTEGDDDDYSDDANPSSVDNESWFITNDVTYLEVVDVSREVMTIPFAIIYHSDYG